jgi:hypothetical protein
MALTPMPDYDSRAARVAWRAGRTVTILTALVLAFLGSLLLISLMFTAARVGLWLLTDHPLVVLPLMAIAVLLVGRKL